jgi:hypothetical protein
MQLEDKTKFGNLKQMKAGWMFILKNLHNVVVFDSTKITAQCFMECVLAQANHKPGNLYTRLDMV